MNCVISWFAERCSTTEPHRPSSIHVYCCVQESLKMHSPAGLRPRLPACRAPDAMPPRFLCASFPMSGASLRTWYSNAISLSPSLLSHPWEPIPPSPVSPPGSGEKDRAPQCQAARAAESTPTQGSGVATTSQTGNEEQMGSFYKLQGAPLIAAHPAPPLSPVGCSQPRISDPLCPHQGASWRGPPRKDRITPAHTGAWGYIHNDPENSQPFQWLPFRGSKHRNNLLILNRNWKAEDRGRTSLKRSGPNSRAQAGPGTWGALPTSL